MILYLSKDLKIKILLLLLTSLLSTTLLSPIAETATFTINSASDSHDFNPGDGIAADNSDSTLSVITLRSAVEEANSLTGADTILIPDYIGVIRLSLGPLIISDDSALIESISGKPVIDGFSNEYGTNMFEIISNYNSIRGLKIQRSRADAILITGSYNVIGGTTSTHRNILVANGLDYENTAAVAIESPTATGNKLFGNFIGVEGNSTTVNSNRIGIRLARSTYDNYIGLNDNGHKNVISGNSLYGILIESYSNNNKIRGNYIGPDSIGFDGPGNNLGGILIRTGAHSNQIGYVSLEQGNLISGNKGFGIRLEGEAVQLNHIYGNRIGTSRSGRTEFPNQGNGIEIADGASNDIIGDSTGLDPNLISGNNQNGIWITGIGTSYNNIVGNFIGISESGFGWLGNGLIDGSGILIDNCASSNRIGGDSPDERNIISGNRKFGVHISGLKTKYNRITANFIGLNKLGTSSIYNSTGVAITDGASYNEVGGRIEVSEGNVISSNRADQFPYGSGILIEGEGSDNNVVYGNIIGLDVTKTRARPNYTAGIIIGNGAKYNNIGSTDPLNQNLITGNGSGDYLNSIARGVHIFGSGTEFNSIEGNIFGLNATRTLQNKGHGIGIFSGASNNVIGSNDGGANSILFNQGHGIVINGPLTKYNIIKDNLIMSNDSTEISLRNAANDGIKPPVIIDAYYQEAYNFWKLIISYTSATPGSNIDIYSSRNTSDVNHLLGLYSSFQNVDSSGIYIGNIYHSNIDRADTIFRLIITDINGNSSEASLPFIISQVTSTENEAAALPFETSLSRNFPNPFNPETNISFTLPQRSDVNIEIFNSVGQQVTTLTNKNYPAGEFNLIWDGKDHSGNSVASGVYFYRLSTDNFTQSRKMLLLK